MINFIHNLQIPTYLDKEKPIAEEPLTEKILFAKFRKCYYPGYIVDSNALSIYFFHIKQIVNVIPDHPIYKISRLIGGNVSYIENGFESTGRLVAVRDDGQNVKVLIGDTEGKSMWIDISRVFLDSTLLEYF